jgi:hypothetical protein
MRGAACNHVAMRRLPLLAAATSAVLILTGCAHDEARDLARYYDEQGLFTLDLPAENEIVVTPPQEAADGPGLLTGVVSSPPTPSPQAQPGLGSSLTPTQQTDQTIYQAYAVTTNGFEDLDQMALYFLTGDPTVDVVQDERTRLDGDPAELVVADVRSDGEVTASVAMALTLGDGKTGYLVAAIFPPGSWDGERPDFARVVRSFRAEVPPGLTTFPVGAEGS